MRAENQTFLSLSLSFFVYSVVTSPTSWFVLKWHKSNWRRVVLSQDLISIEFLWTFQRIAKKSYFKCQLSTECFSLFVLLVWCFFVVVAVLDGVPAANKNSVVTPLPLVPFIGVTFHRRKFEYVSRFFSLSPQFHFSLCIYIQKKQALLKIFRNKGPLLLNADATPWYSVFPFCAVWTVFYCSSVKILNIYLKYCKYLRRVQWRPFHPWEQTQVPFLHWPCSAQRVSHGSWSHKFPT